MNYDLATEEITSVVHDPSHLLQACTFPLPMFFTLFLYSLLILFTQMLVFM